MPKECGKTMARANHNPRTFPVTDQFPPLPIPTTSRNKHKDATYLFQVLPGARNCGQVPCGKASITDGRLQADICEPTVTDEPTVMGRERRVMSLDMER